MNCTAWMPASKRRGAVRAFVSLVVSHETTAYAYGSGLEEALPFQLWTAAGSST